MDHFLFSLRFLSSAFIFYPANLNPSTIFVLNARWIGKIDATIPIINAAPAAIISVEGVIKSKGRIL